MRRLLALALSIRVFELGSSGADLGPDPSAPKNTPDNQAALSRCTQPIRVAIGGFGLSEEERNGQLCDLIVSQLSSSDRLELVERRSLDLALHEAELSLSGLVRASDAVRVGRLVRADWFVLGSTVRRIAFDTRSASTVRFRPLLKLQSPAGFDGFVDRS